MVSTLGSRLLFKELSLRLYVRPDDEECQEGRHDLREYEDDQIADDYLVGLVRYLAFEPIGREVDDNDADDLVRRVADRAVRAVELAPLVCVRLFVDSGYSVAGQVKRIRVFGDITVACGFVGVRVQHENIRDHVFS